MLKNRNVYNLEGVTLLVTHYNRTESLKRLLLAFRDLGCVFQEIVVSDDGSKMEHLEILNSLKNEFNFRLITTPVNKGLGNNLNKGQDAVNTPYTLYVQEDFIPQHNFPSRFKESLAFMDEDPDLDIIRYYAYGAYPYLKPFKSGFYKMHVPPFASRYTKIYYYSDHPHLRRSNFLHKFGRYAEGLKGDKTEYRMCISFIQNKGKGLFYKDFQGLFLQVNTNDEPSTMTRENWRMSKNPFISIVRDVYRQFKYNFDIHFLSFKK